MSFSWEGTWDSSVDVDNCSSLNLTFQHPVRNSGYIGRADQSGRPAIPPHGA
ncbi:hypothetical protein [Pinirhizobacter sp.]|uniref:hypothetical protein n=1 Tax=Pinirhizobacter sp. TaxID=2950432 RepID=UPI002F40C2CB